MTTQPMRATTVVLLTSLLAATPACTQQTGDPLGGTIGADYEPIVVGVTEFATLPDQDGDPVRMMNLVDEPATGRLFVNGMRGPIFTISHDGSTVVEYLDIDDSRWGVQVQASGRERGFQSFALHPQFAEEGAPGYGRIYSWTDSRNTAPEPDFRPGGGGDSHDTVLLEWTATDHTAATYDGGPPRELARFEQPFGNHNAGHAAFNPDAGAGDVDYGLLYLGVADGGSGGDPLNLAQDLSSGFGKIFRIDPLGSNSANGQYGIPADNPFAGDDGALAEIYAYGMRNPQRFGWDSETGMLYMADIGQNTIEELSPVPPGGNLGWNVWEGSYRYLGRSGVDMSDPRSDPSMTYPVAEYRQGDPLLIDRAAATGVVVYREGPVAPLIDFIVWGDFPSGEIFAVPADDPPQGGESALRRVLLDDGSGEPKTLLQLMREKNAEQGRSPASRTDLRFGTADDGRIFLLNKHDGTIRVLGG